MLRLARRGAPLAFLVVFALPTHGMAAPTGVVHMTNFVFSPDSGTGPLNTKIIWQNDSTLTSHTSTSDAVNPDGSTGIALWNSGTVPAGGQYAFTLRAAGTYPYHCTFHELQGMEASVSIKPRIQPPNGQVGDTFTLTLAVATPPSGFVFDIRKKDPGGMFQDWMTGVTTASVTFIPTAPGTYEFMARLRRTSNNGASLYSPAVSIIVS